MDKPKYIPTENTFGDYQFEDWVNQHVRELITDMWGIMGRTHKDWLADAYGRELCHHGPNPNGFGEPPYGARIFFFSRKAGTENYERIEGRYIHRWCNMGSVIDDDGKDHYISSCDCWVRKFQSVEEAKTVLGDITGLHIF